ncbi:hypothetical protein GIB67_032965 [Kingdonia uniflora]|uniref:EamA domain-containing protein n=1 Tax=Kingdonia uniflora TaxID=39325 RepID=A0A7J7MY65_9MAGN|nr:hypothetical protein GIB67_032965 [Kingdonia uniflora]
MIAGNQVISTLSLYSVGEQDMGSYLNDFGPFAGMITIEFTDVGLTTLSKAAMSRGMSPFVYVVYYNALGTFLLLPSFIKNRKERPPLTFSILCRFFLLGLIGIGFAQTLAFVGISYSSPTLCAAMGNLMPAFTFILAVIFRMERLNLRHSSSRAKSLGTVVSISGAFIVTLYKGPPVIIYSHHLIFLPQPNWVLGGTLLAITCLLASIWIVLQAATIKEYPSQTTIVFFYCFFGTIQAAIFSLILERDPSAWTIKPDIELVAILYSGVFGSVFRVCVHTWGIQKKGPLYVAMFRPLGIVIAVVMGVSFLGDTLHVGSVVGAIVITFGFYAVMWGKANEEKMSVDYEDSSSARLGMAEDFVPNQDYILAGCQVTYAESALGFDGSRLCFVEILGSFGIRYSSPTLSSAMANLIPAFTFALATIFRMEKLNLRSWSSRAKLLGTIVSISGAFTVTLYKGPPIIIFFSTPLQLSLSPQPNWILGGILLAVTCLLAAIWNVLQAATVKKYPSQMTVVFFYCFFGTIQCALFSLIAERDPSAWRLKPDIELVSIVYSGVFGSVFRTCIHTWGIHKKGPLYVAMFRPLGIVIAVVMGVSFLGDTLHVGSVVGAIVISSGFYAVIWGKSKEEKMSNENEVVSLGSSSLNSPLLRNKDTDISKFPTLLLQ